MLRQHLVAYRKAWASGLVIAATAVGGLVVSNLVFTTSSSADVNATSTELVTPGSLGKSLYPRVSGNGRFVVFETFHPFDPRDAGGRTSAMEDVYVYDTVLETRTLISHSNPDARGAVTGANGRSVTPAISRDGRYVVFQTFASDIGPSWGDDVTQPPRIVVCDRGAPVNGVFGDRCTFTMVSADEWTPRNPEISADGSAVLYEVDAPLPVVLRASGSPGASGGPVDDASEPAGPDDDHLVLVDLRHEADGALAAPTAANRVRVTAPRELAVDSRTGYLRTVRDSTLSADGRHVAFVGDYSSQLESAGALHTSTVLHYDVATAGLERLDVDADGKELTGAHRWALPALSGDGRRYAFVERDPQDDDEGPVWLYDRDPDGDGRLWPGTGARLSREMGSRHTDGTPGNGDTPAFSADGRYFAFATGDGNTHTGWDPVDNTRKCSDHATHTPQSNRACDIVMRDLVLDARRVTDKQPRLPSELVSVSVRNDCEAPAGRVCPGNGHSFGPSVADDGSFVAYNSGADNLVTAPRDENDGVPDVYLRSYVPTLGAAAQDFGGVEVGASAIREVTVRHSGFGPIAVRSFAVAGADAADFAVFPGETCTRQVLHADDRCTVSIRFRPTAAGPRSAVVRMTPTRGAVTEFAVRGSGVTPDGTFAAGPGRLDFGARGVLRTSESQSVTVRNNGRGPLHVRTVKLDGTEPIAHPKDYQVTGDTCGDRVLAAGALCTVSVRHRPTAVGARNGVLRIDYDGPTNPPAPGAPATPGTSAAPTAGPTLSAGPTAGPSIGASPSAGASASAGAAPALRTFVVELVGSGTAPKLESGLKMIPVGDVTQLKGTNFPPNSEVSLGFDKRPAGKKVRTDANGSFTTTFVVMSHSELGRRTLRAEVAAGSPAELTTPVAATTDVVLRQGTLQPPDFLNRR